MGVLYYFAKDDGSRELFALNKVHHYARWNSDMRGSMNVEAAFGEARRIADVFATPAEFAETFVEPDLREWGERIGRRLMAWAGDVPIRFLSEYGVDELHDDLTHRQHRAVITGSAYDSDYEADGVTYKPGSAW